MQGSVENATVIAAARRAVSDLRPDVPPRFRTMETVVSTSVADRRFTLLLIGVFGASALLLATLGVYGVISYLVTQRRQEIGVRIALGAQSTDVMKLVLRQGALLAGIGSVVGDAAALALTRLIRGMLFDVSTTAPLAFAAVILCMLAVALLASFIPARRAAGIAPMSILRGG
jgi:ABC-type antimicrobial peptide transport system permease subunit